MATSYWDRLLERRLSRRQALSASGAAGLGGALLIACGGGGGGTLKLDDAGTARVPGTVWFAKNDWRLADETKPAARGGIYRGFLTADHAGHYDALSLPSSQVPSSAHVHETLMGQARSPGVDPGSVAGSTPVPVLAESWEFADGGARVTFKMRPGVKWHNIAPVNGRVMDIDDWKSSQERHLVTGTVRVFLEQILDKAEFPDSTTMVWKLKSPYAPIIDQMYSDKLLGYPMLPKELNANPALAESTTIGTGYKILDRRQPAITMEYRKHPEYWGGDPFIERWHQPIIPEYANRYAQFIAGNILDFTSTPRDVLQLIKDAPQAVTIAEEIREDQATFMRFGRISPNDWSWADPRVRIAIRRSIDFKAIGKFLSNKESFEANGVPVELSPMTHVNQKPGYWLNPEKGELGKLSENYLYDAAEARKLVGAAGHRIPVELPFFVEPNRGEIQEQDQLLMDSLEAAGAFKLNVHRSLNSVEHRQYRTFGQMDGISAVANTGQYEADYFVAALTNKGAYNPQAYPDPRIDNLLQAQRFEIDIQKRNELLKEFQRVAAELMPTVPGYHLYSVFRTRMPWLRNFNYGQSSASSPPEGRPRWGGHLHWLDSEMPNRDRRI